ncbi:hypothetical protein K502DRAFT_354017, partial [Neoconidiobolus thromboides FSU 785]
MDSPSKEELNNRTQRKSFFIRYKWWIIALISFLLLVAIVLLVVFLVVLPNQRKSNLTKDSTATVKDGLVQKPDLSIIPKDLGSFDDSARANPNVPPLNQPFQYGTDMKIRGVNLGGWLVPEPFI